MDITFSCPNCNQPLTVDEAGAGLTVPCPKCGKGLTIPFANVSPPEPTRINVPEKLIEKWPIAPSESYRIPAGTGSRTPAATSTTIPSTAPKLLSALIVVPMILFVAVVGYVAIDRFQSQTLVRQKAEQAESERQEALQAQQQEEARQLQSQKQTQAGQEQKRAKEQFEAEQRAKGLVQYKGQWITPEENARRQEAERIAALRKEGISREEFSTHVLGMTGSQLIAYAGRPDTTSQSSSDSDDIWYYENLTYDPITGKRDFQAEIVFAGDRVKEVNY